MKNHNGFIMCCNCRNKVKREGLSKGQYYCPYAPIKDGKVYDTTDASECVANNIYEPFR